MPIFYPGCHLCNGKTFPAYNPTLCWKKIFYILIFSEELNDMQFSTVTQSCPIICDPMDCSTPGFHVHHQLPELAQTHIIESVMPSNHLILWLPLLLLPSVFPSINVFCSESVLHIRWPKYWRFSISPSNKYLGLIGSPCSPRDSQESSPSPQFKTINSSLLSFLYRPTLTWLLVKP